MLKKSGINNVCAETVRPRDAIGGKDQEEPALIVVSWRKGIPNVSYPSSPTDIPTSQNRADTSLYLFNFIFENLILHIFLIIIIIIRCSGMFWDIPECPGMFIVPGFIDWTALLTFNIDDKSILFRVIDQNRKPNMKSL